MINNSRHQTPRRSLLKVVVAVVAIALAGTGELSRGSHARSVKPIPAFTQGGARAAGRNSSLSRLLFKSGPDARSLEPNSSALTAAPMMATWSVDNTADTPIGLPCLGFTGCSLREAITSAEMNPGPDAILV